MKFVSANPLSLQSEASQVSGAGNDNFEGSARFQIFFKIDEMMRLY